MDENVQEAADDEAEETRANAAEDAISLEGRKHEQGLSPPRSEDQASLQIESLIELHSTELGIEVPSRHPERLVLPVIPGALPPCHPERSEGSALVLLRSCEADPSSLRSSG